MTARLSLSRPAPVDIDTIGSIHTDPVACAHNPSDLLASRDDAPALFRRWDEHWQRWGFGYWVVRRHESAAPIGFCGVKVMSLNGRDVLNLFYRLTPPAWGDGVAAEAASAVLDWIGRNTAGAPVIARVRPANAASRRVAQRIGLRRAPNLDTDGEDGPDWIFASDWWAEPRTVTTLPDSNEITTRLRGLDDPEHPEFPDGFANRAERGRFTRLVDDLERRFGTRCVVDDRVQDASYLGQVTVPAEATTKGEALFVRVSNFGGLVLLGAGGPGRYHDRETRRLIGDRDWAHVVESVTSLDYVPLMEDVLHRPYDGPSHVDSWFIRFFDYL